MSEPEERMFLVGDNPFLGISHLSQKRARDRRQESSSCQYAANLITASLENGANGFMFTVSEMALLILKELRKRKSVNMNLCAIVPYAYEYVKLAAQAGVSGIAKQLAKQMMLSGNVRTVTLGLKGLVRADPKILIDSYVNYELSRTGSSVGKRTSLRSLMLHQTVTDMALALNLKWFFESYVDLTSKNGVAPGFNTGNFAYLVKKCREWKIDLNEILIATPFNKAGFQMSPSKEECEEALKTLPKPTVIAISILAGGYLRPQEAIDYIAMLPNIRGVAVGVSNMTHVRETFGYLRKKLDNNPGFWPPISH
jgi:hypothetical protein